MKDLQEIYWPDDVQAIAEVRYKLSSLQMTVDENPNELFCKLATLEHAYGRVTDQDMIRASFSLAQAILGNT